MRRSLLFLLLVISLLPANAQENMELYTRIVESCYKFKFKTADSLINQFEKQSPGIDALLLRSNLQWWQIISGNDRPATRQQYYQTLLSAEKLLLQEKKTGNDLHIYRAIFLYGYLARMDGLNNHYLKAFLRMRTCYKHLQKSFGHEERFNYFYLSSGLYNYHMDNAGANYPVLIPYLYFYPEGDAKKGIQMLEKAAMLNNKILNTEATYFLMKIYIDEKKYIPSLTYSTKLVLTYPNNCLYLYYQFYALLQLNQVEDAKEILTKIIRISESNVELNGTQNTYFAQLAQKNIQEHLNKKK